MGTIRWALVCVVCVSCAEDQNPVSVRVIDACSAAHPLVPLANTIEISVKGGPNGLTTASFSHAAGSGNVNVVPGGDLSVITVLGHGLPRPGETQAETVFAMGIGGIDLFESEGKQIGVVVGAPDAFVQSTYATEQVGLCSYMGEQRRALSGAMMQDGRVLLVGGEQRNPTSVQVWDSTEIFDPRTGAFTAGPALRWARRNHTVTTSSSGLVVIAGGQGRLNGSADGLLETWRTASVYDPVRNSFVGDGIAMVEQRANHTATVMRGDRVIIIGGNVGDTIHASTEIINLRTGRSKAGPTLSVARTYHTAVAVGDGLIAVIGGQSAEGPVDSIEFIVIEEVRNEGVTQEVIRVVDGPKLQHARTAPAAVFDASKSVLLIAGGFTESLPLNGNIPDRVLAVSAHVDVVLTNAQSPALSRSVCSETPLERGRAWAGVVPVAGGMVLAGGLGSSGEALGDAVHLSVSDLARCTLDIRASKGSLVQKRIAPAVVVLGDGDVFLAGGVGEDIARNRVTLDTAEIYIRAR